MTKCLSTIILVFPLAGACFRSGFEQFSSGSDASNAGDGSQETDSESLGVDDGSVPDKPGDDSEPEKPFGPPVNLTQVNTPDYEQDASVSPDGLTLIFANAAPGSIAGSVDIWTAVRPTTLDRFSQPSNLAEVNSENWDSGPKFSFDMLDLYFHTTLPASGTGTDIWISSRRNPQEPFDSPQPLPGVNTSFWDGDMTITSDSLTIFLVSDRPGGVGGSDIWVTTRATKADSFGPVVNASSVNSDVEEWEPDITADGLHLYFASDRPGGLGEFDIWRVDRSSITADFDPPVNVSEVNSEYHEDGPGISADGHILFFSSTRPGGIGDGDIWVSVQQ